MRSTLCLLCLEEKGRCTCGTNRHRLLAKQQARSKPRFFYIPTSDEKALRLHLIGCVEQMRLRWSWVALVPARVGWDRAVDSACVALCHAQQYRRVKPANDTAWNTALQSYATTIQLLRKLLESPSTAVSDAALATVALIVLFEVIMRRWSGKRQKDVISHWSGIVAILSARATFHEATDLTRAIVHTMYDCTFGVSTALGTPSPFESNYWLELDPVSVDATSTDLRAVQKSSHQTHIRLPRLISYVRALRQGVHDPDALDVAVRLAHELLLLEVEEAENSVLHRLKVIQTVDAADQIIVPVSFQFASLQQYRSALLYWGSRNIVINLCLTLVSLSSPAQPPFDTERLETTQDRMNTNLVMSWQYAQAHGEFAAGDFAQSVISVWQALKSRDSFRGRPPSTVRQWLLPKMNHRLVGWTVGGTDDDMDVASDLLAGGPLAGFIVDAAEHAAPPE